ncbi:cytochrome P450 [Cognatishimia sp. MH4019]|uniref:cytochrome P450 n=1 Tax=Cognatishimia sp. MH4019 TaxID=2854030 RepID=UPI00351D2C78
MQNPYPFYAECRALGDMVYWSEYGMACAASQRAVEAALRHPKMGRECPPELAPPIAGHTQPFYDIEAHSMLELEPPRHTELRKLVLHGFTSRKIKGLAGDIEVLCHQLIDQFPNAPFDLLEAYAKPLPVTVITRLLGVEDAMGDQLLRWSNAMVAMYQATRSRAIEDAAATASTEFAAFIRDEVTRKRRAPGDDLISHLIAAEEGDAKLSDAALISTCILLLNAGHEATVHTIGNGVKTLLETGPQKITETCVEEVLRFDPPLHMFTRYVYEDMEFFGAKLTRGDQVACLLGSANRDAAVYPDPDRFLAQRQAKRHTAFGGGIHFCVGAPLARLELLIGLRVLFERCPKLRLAASPKYANIYHFHGLERLMVQI